MTWKEYARNELGYESFTTFWDDFSIADAFGTAAIKDTYNRAFNEWKNDYKYLTELVMVLNHKCWYYNDKKEDYCELYADLYEKAYQWGLDNLKDDELTYFWSTLD